MRRRIVFFILVWIGTAQAAMPVFAQNSQDTQCTQALQEKNVPTHFTRLARKQLVMEYGAATIKISKVSVHTVSGDLYRVDAFLQITKPEHDNAASFWATGFVSRCEGTLIFRGNTWLADGNLVVPRFTRTQLPGRGLVLGEENAPLQVIVFVDSRCPHCHRLIAYARDLLLTSSIRIEFRQVAYLETAVEAVKDTRLFETALFQEGTNALRADAYLDMLGEFNSSLDVDVNAPMYEPSLALILTNTRTARDVLHASSVPVVLVLDKNKNGAYRHVGLTEMNRLFQPEM